MPNLIGMVGHTPAQIGMVGHRSGGVESMIAYYVLLRIKLRVYRAMPRTYGRTIMRSKGSRMPATSPVGWSRITLHAHQERPQCQGNATPMRPHQPATLYLI